jgi:hypothetical protein
LLFFKRLDDVHNLKSFCGISKGPSCRADKRKPAAPVELELRLLKAKKRACRLQHFVGRPISAQVVMNMLTERSMNPHIRPMIRHLSFKAFAAGLLALSVSTSEAPAGDQAKAIVNALDSKSMNELFEAARRQPDAAMTSIAPVSANTFRFLFIWPASNTVMTYERVGRSFAERFVGFADQFKLLVKGFCLPAHNMFFGTAAYGEEEVNIAYRDIEVRYLFGWQPPCPGRFIPIDNIEHPNAAPSGYGAFLPLPAAPPNQITTPEDGLKPFLNPQPSIPLE